MLLWRLLIVMIAHGLQRGDFNVLKSILEISGGHAQPQGAIDAINLALSDCSLKDLGFVGSPFTWTNGHTQRHLDRAISNVHWYVFFSIFWVTHMNRAVLDHSPLLLSYDRNTTRGPAMFKFLHAWLNHSGFIVWKYRAAPFLVMK